MIKRCCRLAQLGRQEEHHFLMVEKASERHQVGVRRRLSA